MSWDRVLTGGRNPLFGTWYQPTLFVGFGVVAAWYGMWLLAAIIWVLAALSAAFVWWWKRRGRER